jgi:hypothetical protein
LDGQGKSVYHPHWVFVDSKRQNFIKEKLTQATKNLPHRSSFNTNEAFVVGTKRSFVLLDAFTAKDRTSVQNAEITQNIFGLGTPY